MLSRCIRGLACEPRCGHSKSDMVQEDMASRRPTLLCTLYGTYGQLFKHFPAWELLGFIPSMSCTLLYPPPEGCMPPHGPSCSFLGVPVIFSLLDCPFSAVFPLPCSHRKHWLALWTDSCRVWSKGVNNAVATEPLRQGEEVFIQRAVADSSVRAHRTCLFYSLSLYFL